MTQEEFLSSIQSRGARLAPACDTPQITIANTALQNIRAAMMPMIMIELYKTCGAINLGTGYIFGPSEVGRGKDYPIPSIVQINNDISSNASMRGKTIFGRNDLFWFAFDSFGAFYMLDNVTLRPLRKYDDGLRAMYDCLMGGRI